MDGTRLACSHHIDACPSIFFSTTRDKISYVEDKITTENKNRLTFVLATLSNKISSMEKYEDNKEKQQIDACPINFLSTLSDKNFCLGMYKDNKEYLSQ